jgi:hypothetical protein
MIADRTCQSALWSDSSLSPKTARNERGYFVAAGRTPATRSALSLPAQVRKRCRDEASNFVWRLVKRGESPELVLGTGLVSGSGAADSAASYCLESPTGRAEGARAPYPLLRSGDAGMAVSSRRLELVSRAMGAALRSARSDRRRGPHALPGTRRYPEPLCGAHLPPTEGGLAAARAVLASTLALDSAGSAPVRSPPVRSSRTLPQARRQTPRACAVRRRRVSRPGCPQWGYRGGRARCRACHSARPRNCPGGD